MTVIIEHQITAAKIVFCYGAKTYHKYIRKTFGVDEYIDQGGVCTAWHYKDEFSIVIGVKKIKDEHQLKGMIMHELSHAVTQLFEEYGFKCDELRSYTLQYLYHEFMPSLDKKRSKR